MNEWISVDDTYKPADGDLCLVVHRPVYYSSRMTIAIFHQYDFISHKKGLLLPHVTHWQPLPEPPHD